MNTHAHKMQENNNQVVPNTVLEKPNGSNPTFQFIDNRPEMIAQRKLQEMVHNYTTQQLPPIQKKENTTAPSSYLGDISENNFDSSIDSSKRVIQRNKKYDKLEEDTLEANRAEDYDHKNITLKEIEEAVLELIGEYLLSKITFYSDYEGKIPITSLEDWEINFTGVMQGGAGIMNLPIKENVLSSIALGKFKPDLAHELGHGIRALEGFPEWQVKINEEIEGAGNSNQREELRADMTGVYIRWLNDEDVELDEYKHLFSEAESDTHPSGELRRKVIEKAIAMTEAETE